MRQRQVLSLFVCGVTCAYLSGCALHPPFLDHPLAPAAVSHMLSADSLLAKEGIVEVELLGAGALPELLRQFPSAEPEARLRIIDVALAIKNPEDLIASLFSLAAHDSTAAVRRHAAARAAKLPQFAAALAPILLELLGDDVPEVRAAALTTLGGFHRPEALSPDILLTLLADQPLIVVATASNLALQRREPYLQAAARAALPRLIGGIHDTHPATRAAALFAIGQFGLTAAPAVTPVKVVVANDPVPEVRLQAALTLQRIGTPAARDASRVALTALLADDNKLISTAAQTALSSQ